ncbi:restriction endonuclease subunit S, partial [Staphylococcus equorum]
VYTGQTSTLSSTFFIDTYNIEGEYLTLTTYGSAGRMEYRNGKGNIGRNCMGLKLKEKFVSKVNLEWFSYKFQNLFYRLRIGEIDGQKSLNQILLNNVSVVIPDMELQEKELLRYRNANEMKQRLENILSSIDEIESNVFTYTEKAYEDLIGNVFNISGGVSGLTTEVMYQNQSTNIEDSIPLLSGSTQSETRLGVIDRNTYLKSKRKIKIFKGPAILVIRKGLAGTMIYIEEGKEFTANDDIYVFTLKNKYKGLVDLLWFINQYQTFFYNNTTSKSDNGTFNKGFFEKQIIKIPNIESQLEVRDRILKTHKIKAELIKDLKIIEELLEVEIIRG